MGPLRLLPETDKTAIRRMEQKLSEETLILEQSYSTGQET